MNSLVGRDYFEVVERRHEELLEAKQMPAALQVARLLYAQTPPDSVEHGVAARNIAAGYNAMQRHRDAWRKAVEAWRIHNAQASSLHALGECAVSGAYVGVMGVLLVHGPEESKDAEQIGARALACARGALEDFGTYRQANDDKPHPLELLSLSRISMTESIFGEEGEGRRLAHLVFERVELGRFGGENRGMEKERAGAYGAFVVASTSGLLREGENLYGAVYEVV